MTDQDNGKDAVPPNILDGMREKYANGQFMPEPKTVIIGGGQIHVSGVGTHQLSPPRSGKERREEAFSIARGMVHLINGKPTTETSEPFAALWDHIRHIRGMGGENAEAAQEQAARIARGIIAMAAEEGVAGITPDKLAYTLQLARYCIKNRDNLIPNSPEFLSGGLYGGISPATIAAVSEFARLRENSEAELEALHGMGTGKNTGMLLRMIGDFSDDLKRHVEAPDRPVSMPGRT